MNRPLSVWSTAVGALIVSLTIGFASNLLFLAAFQFGWTRSASHRLPFAEERAVVRSSSPAERPR